LIHQFQTPEIKTLAGRILARNFSEVLPKEIETQFALYLSRVNPESPESALVDYKGEARTTPAEALMDIQKIKTEEKMEPAQLKLLDELESYLIQTF
jgi:hypothetical protein